jgi:short-subunit dehydrogenase
VLVSGEVSLSHWTTDMARRLALITGASAGIGAAFARILASHGYDVALTARRADRLEALAAEIRLRYGVEAYAIPADLADLAGVDAVLAGVEAQGRVVDTLVNNAGYGLPGTYATTAWADQGKFLQVMLTSVCELTHKVLPGMVERKFGRIVNVASLAGLVPGAAGHTLYAATKGFLVKFSQSLHLENLSTGVHVSACVPASPIRNSTTSTAPAPRSASPCPNGCGWAPTRWPPPATKPSRPTARSACPARPTRPSRRSPRCCPTIGRWR